MSSTAPTVFSHNNESEHGTIGGYVVGFVLSVVFTLGAYFLAVNHLLGRRFLIVLVVAFALIQFIVQVVFFLHLGRETKPRWKLAVFLFMIMIVLIIVFGSLWIMSSLNYNMMASPKLMERYMNSQIGL